MTTSHMLVVLMLSLPQFCCGADDSIVYDLPRLTLGASYDQVHIVRPRLSAIDVGTGRPLEIVPKSGEVMARESIPKDAWFTSALYGFSDYQLEFLHLGGDEGLPWKERLKLRNCLLSALISILGEPTHRVVVRTDVHGLGESDVPQIIWDRKTELIILHLPIAEHGSHGNLTYALTATKPQNAGNFLKGREKWSQKKVDGFFRAAGIEVNRLKN